MSAQIFTSARGGRGEMKVRIEAGDRVNLAYRER